MVYMIVFTDVADNAPCVSSLFGPFKNEEEAVRWGQSAFGVVGSADENDNWCDASGEVIFTLKTLTEPAR